MEENFIEQLINNLRQDRELIGNSLHWANWMSKLLPNSCKYCVEQHGKIVDISILKNKTEDMPIVLLNCHQHRGEFGMKQILIMLAENEIVKEFYIQMTG